LLWKNRTPGRPSRQSAARHQFQTMSDRPRCRWRPVRALGGRSQGAVLLRPRSGRAAASPGLGSRPAGRRTAGAGARRVRASARAGTRWRWRRVAATGRRTTTCTATGRTVARRRGTVLWSIHTARHDARNSTVESRLAE